MPYARAVASPLWSGGSRPVSILNKVVLPAPLWPNKQVHSPWFRRSAAPSTALKLPKVLAKPANSTAPSDASPPSSAS